VERRGAIEKNKMVTVRNSHFSSPQRRLRSSAVAYATFKIDISGWVP
jgi:hypothetical protein